MSRFRVILAVILGFSISPLLVGMDSLWSGKKLSKNHLSKDIENLMLFNMKEADSKGIVLPQDVKSNIVRIGYKLYYDQVLEEESSWLDQHSEYTDNFDFMTMNVEGRNFFKILHSNQHGGWTEFSPEQYNGIIKLPMELKRKKKPLINVVTNSYPLSHKIANSDYIFSAILVGGTLSGAVAAGVALQTISGSSLFTRPNIFVSPMLVVGGGGVGLGLSLRLILKAVDLSHKYVVVEKSLFTSEEQSMLETEKEEARKIAKSVAYALSPTAEKEAQKAQSIADVLNCTALAEKMRNKELSCNIRVKSMKMKQFKQLEMDKSDWLKKLNRE